MKFTGRYILYLGATVIWTSLAIGKIFSRRVSPWRVDCAPLTDVALYRLLDVMTENARGKIGMAEDNSTDDESPVVVQHGGSSLIECKPLFTNDSKCLICASGDLIKVYSVISGECLQVLQGHSAAVNALLFEPRNQYHLLSCSDDGKVIKWNFEEGSLIKQYEFGFPLLGLWKADDPNSFLTLKQSSHEKWQVVKFSLPRQMPDKRVDVQVILDRCEPDRKHIAIDCKKEFIANIFYKTLRITKFKKLGKPVRLSAEKETKFTCVACHPTDDTVVTGCRSGKIYLWFNVLSDNVVKTFNHWHALPVLDVSFTAHGSYLLSGGHECVLVKWQHNSHHKDTLPRLGAPLHQISCSQDNTLYATCHSDNVIQIISNTFNVVQIIQGLTRRHVKEDQSIFQTGLLLDPRSNAMVTNGRPGHLQFYSLHNDKQLYNLDIVGQNYISPTSLDKQLVLTELENAALTHDGKWLATVERRDDGITSAEIRLKFWCYDDESQNYKLNTKVDLPHEQRVCTLKFRNENEASDLMLVSTSLDGKFKLWQLVDDTDIYRKNLRWNCESAGFYQNHKAGPADFSEDGSLLAVGFNNHLTLWDPDTNALRLALLQRTGVISHLAFGSGTCSHLLASVTETALTVWNMLSCSADWSLNLAVSVLTMDSITEHMAVFTNKKELLVFKPNSSDIVHRQINVSKENVTSAIFIPRRDSSSKGLPWQRLSQLYYLTEDQHLMTIKSKMEVRAGIKTQRQKIAENLPQTAFSLLMIKERKRLTGAADSHTQLGNPGAKYLKEMLNTPAHVMPGVSSLCMSFMDTLLIKDASAKIPADEDSDDDETEEKMQQEDSDSDMEVDAPKPVEIEEDADSQNREKVDRLTQYDDVTLEDIKLLIEHS